MSSSPVTRRRLLLSAAVVGTLAGCSSDPGGSTDTDAPNGEAPNGEAPATDRSTSGATTVSTGGPTTEPGGADDPASGEPDTDAPSTTAADAASATTEEEPDLREANVVGVAFERAGGGYRFDVTLYHDDDGEDGYANWWQVETLGGERLGRRELLHAHGTTPFTRSETISVPDGTRYVVVRGHDQTHGYGGDAVVVDLETGETRRIRQGPEPWDLSAFASAG
jgi:hypothetical protein